MYYKRYTCTMKNLISSTALMPLQKLILLAKFHRKGSQAKMNVST